jgi:uncharacterized sporulation protein YeaH/YhbH (DUF444 family)
VSKFEVKVVYKGYEDVISSSVPRVVAEVMSILSREAAHEHPMTERVRELEEKLDKAEASASSANYYKKKAEEKLETLKNEIKEKASE